MDGFPCKLRKCRESLVVGGRKMGVDIEKKWLVVNKQGQVPVPGERRVCFSKAFWDRECL